MRRSVLAATAALVLVACQGTGGVQPPPPADGYAIVRELRQPGEAVKVKAAMLSRLRHDNAVRLRINTLVDDLLRRLSPETSLPGDPVFVELTAGQGSVDVPEGPLEAVLVITTRAYPEPALVLAPIDTYSRGEYRPPGTIASYVLELQGHTVRSSCDDLCARESIVLIPVYRR